MATIRWRRSRCTTTRSSGVPSGPGRIWPVVGGRYSDEWQADHLRDPQSVVPESVMPKYGFLENKKYRRQIHR